MEAEEPVKQQDPLAPPTPEAQRSHAGVPDPSGSETGNVKLMVPLMGAVLALALSVPTGGDPGLLSGETVTY